MDTCRVIMSLSFDFLFVKCLRKQGSVGWGGLPISRDLPCGDGQTDDAHFFIEVHSALFLSRKFRIAGRSSRRFLMTAVFTAAMAAAVMTIFPMVMVAAPDIGIKAQIACQQCIYSSIRLAVGAAV